jgi:hypothetical protein
MAASPAQSFRARANSASLANCARVGSGPSSSGFGGSYFASKLLPPSVPPARRARGRPWLRRALSRLRPRLLALLGQLGKTKVDLLLSIGIGRLRPAARRFGLRGARLSLRRRLNRWLCLYFGSRSGLRRIESQTLGVKLRGVLASHDDSAQSSPLRGPWSAGNTHPLVCQWQRTKGGIA